MKIKAKNRSMILWYSAVFLVLSFMFLHVQVAIIREVTAFDSTLFLYNLSSLKFVFSFILITIPSLLLLKRASVLFFSISLLSISIFGLIFITENFSKILLIFWGIHTIMSFYFYQLLSVELKEACYNPKFSKNDLYPPTMYKIPVVLSLEEKSINGTLTNWDENSVFIYFDKPTSTNNLAVMDIEISFASNSFKAKGLVVTELKNKMGLGLKLLENDEQIFNYETFYKVCNDRGISTEVVS